MRTYARNQLAKLANSKEIEGTELSCKLASLVEAIDKNNRSKKQCLK
jgi:hypothetical protein